MKSTGSLACSISGWSVSLASCEPVGHILGHGQVHTLTKSIQVIQNSVSLRAFPSGVTTSHKSIQKPLHKRIPFLDFLVEPSKHPTTDRKNEWPSPSATKSWKIHVHFKNSTAKVPFKWIIYNVESPKACQLWSFVCAFVSPRFWKRKWSARKW